jgi:hypothetical protein
VGPAWLILLCITVASLIAATIGITSVLANPGPVGNSSGFEDDDANLIVNTTFDWNSFSRVSWLPTGSTTPTRQADKVVSGWTFKGIEDWDATTADSGFAGGTKQDDNCATVITAKAPNKDDLKRIYLSSKTVDIDPTAGVNNHVFLNLAWVRIPQNTTSPSAHVAFEFNKGTTACGSTSPLVQRTAGDMLIVYDFEGGAGTPVLTLRRWVTSGACEIGSNSAPCWGTATNLTAGGFAEAAVNVENTALDQLAPPALSASTSVDATLGLSEFGEAGIDLTGAGVFTQGQCESFGKVFGVSRSSGNSGTAQMKDLVGPGNFNLRNCGTVTIIKHTVPANLNQNFGFTSNLAGTCTADATPASFTLNDSGTDTETCQDVPAGSYTVTEGANPANFTFTDLSCTASGTGTSATPASGNATKTASITIAGGGSATCTYTNSQLLGAIKVTKTRKHAADGAGDHPHAGVSFTVNGVTQQTDANGVTCFDGLPFTSYTVHETVPAGYHVDANDKSVTVDNNATCSDNPYVGETVSFHNTPLTNVTVSVDSQVAGGTSSTIDCEPTATDPDAGPGDDISVTLSDLEPMTLTCTIVIDP